MTIKNSLALEIKKLLTGLSEHGSQHLSEIETDLVQTNILLSEAIEKPVSYTHLTLPTKA